MKKIFITPIKKNIAQLLDYYPRYCLICQRKTTHNYLICSKCLPSLPFIAQQSCAVCRIRLTNYGMICGQCLKKTYAFDQVMVPFYYEKPITRLLFQMKFHERLASLSCFSYFLTKQIKQYNTPLPEVLIPVPLHKKRLRNRGYNQSLELAKALSLALNVSINRHCCQRIRFTQPQQTLKIKERIKNVKNSFHCHRNLSYSHVSIIDDIMTTGETVHEMAKCLKRKGVKTVQVWCCARA